MDDEELSIDKEKIKEMFSGFDIKRFIAVCVLCALLAFVAFVYLYHFTSAGKNFQIYDNISSECKPKCSSIDMSVGEVGIKNIKKEDLFLVGGDTSQFDPGIIRNDYYVCLCEGSGLKQKIIAVRKVV